MPTYNRHFYMFSKYLLKNIQAEIDTNKNTEKQIEHIT